MNETIAKYTQPIHADQVAGSNIEYDSDFQTLLMLVQDKPEQQFGDLIIEASSIDWDKVYHISGDLLLNKSKDLLVMSYFTQSSTVLYGLEGFVTGLAIIAQNLEQYWPVVYPRLEDEDGDFDPDYRVNALSLFSAYDGIIKNLRNAFLLKNGLSQTAYTLKDIEGVIDKRADMLDNYPGGLNRLAIDLQIAFDNHAPEILALQSSLDYLAKIKQHFADHIPDVDLKFDHLERMFHKFINLMGTTPVETNPIETMPLSSDSHAPDDKPTVANWQSYQVNSRKDVELLLEKIFRYFEKHEPTHPAPLFIRRIQRLMNLNFYEIMRDISPESLDKLDMLVGKSLDNSLENYDND